MQRSVDLTKRKKFIKDHTDERDMSDSQIANSIRLVRDVARTRQRRCLHQCPGQGSGIASERGFCCSFAVAKYAPIGGWEKTWKTHILKLSIAGTLLIIDTLHPLIRHPTLNLAAFLSSLITPTSSLVAIYHLDIPLHPEPASTYAPDPLTLLKYLCTTLLTVHSLSQTLARKAAADRSVAAPAVGLNEEVEGVLKGLGGNDRRGVVVEMEYRRKSGRAVAEWFFLPADTKTGTLGAGTRKAGKERAILLEDHSLYRRLPAELEGVGEDEGRVQSTFDLGLTEKQRRDREGIVLPYFDAQKEEGGGGGRILYDMGEEDDFDEEEDEI